VAVWGLQPVGGATAGVGAGGAGVGPGAGGVGAGGEPLHATTRSPAALVAIDVYVQLFPVTLRVTVAPLAGVGAAIRPNAPATLKATGICRIILFIGTPGNSIKAEFSIKAYYR
jgi:hypothetical protein